MALTTIGNGLTPLTKISRRGLTSLIPRRPSSSGSSPSNVWRKPDGTLWTKPDGSYWIMPTPPPPLLSEFTKDGFHFAYFGRLPQPGYAFAYQAIQGITLIRNEVRQGDKPSGDSANERSRMQDHNSPVAYNTEYDIGFYLMPGANYLTATSGEVYVAPFELHARSIPGDSPETAGPISLMEQWSGGSNANRFRVVRRTVPMSGGFITGGSTDNIVGSTGTVHAQNTLYFLRVQFKLSDGGDGFLKVTQSIVTGGVVGPGTELGSYTGPLGYGAARSHYIQIGTYRPTKPATSVVHVGLRNITVV